ncbi:MAG: CDP-diacylglycerol--serine O-phosphatidyltransferase [Alphaproteobacteria bacterium]|nr:CDP-diacylglycerol--serine O-phosphatidyltransferase [Alphaproteobacteria bacterium]
MNRKNKMAQPNEGLAKITRSSKEVIKKKAIGKFKEVPFRKMAPNMVTLMALCAGISTIKFAIIGKWSYAVACIFLACIFDGLDGRVARKLKASSKFGAELDSLSDFVSFGVAPAILMYQWCLHSLPHWGWIFTLMFSAGMAMRLARFNTMLEDTNVPEYWSHYFVGVPAPMAAAMAIMPLLISFDYPELDFILRNKYFCSFLMILVAFLMVSRIPTLSLKKTKISADWFLPLMVLLALFVSCLLTQPWLTLGLFTVTYICTIPYTIIKFIREKRAFEKQ